MTANDIDSREGNSPSRSGNRPVEDVPSRLLNSRRLREAAETDVQFLQNRLAKLKSEESKAVAEIERTRKKTAEILLSRQQYEDRLQKRREQLQREEYSRRKDAAMLSLDKEKQLKKIWDAKAKLLEEKRNRVAASKRERDMHRCRSHIQQQELAQRAALTREIVRKQHFDAKASFEQGKEHRAKAVATACAERAAEEERKRVEVEKLASQLVQQEAQYIYRLKRMQAEKQAAIRDLAAAIEVVGTEQRAASLGSSGAGAQTSGSGAGTVKLPPASLKRSESGSTRRSAD